MLLFLSGCGEPARTPEPTTLAPSVQPAPFRIQLAEARLLCTQLAQDLASHRRDRNASAIERLRRLFGAILDRDIRRAHDPAAFDRLKTGFDTTLGFLDAARAREDWPDFANRREALDLLLTQLDRFNR